MIARPTLYRSLLGLMLSCGLTFDAYTSPQAKITTPRAKQADELIVFRGIDQAEMNRWVDSVYQSLDLEARVGQLIMPIIYNATYN